MTSRSRSRNWVLVAVAVAVPVLVIVGLRLAARVEDWPASLGANAMQRVKGKPLTLYSCDNETVLHQIPCHDTSDPDSMMVVLHDEPAGEVSARFPDPGTGISASMLELRFLGGTVWVRVEAHDRRGWIARDYTR